MIPTDVYSIDAPTVYRNKLARFHQLQQPGGDRRPGAGACRHRAAHKKLVNTRLAYVSVSRGRYDAKIYTNDAVSLSEGLSKEVSKRSALEAERSNGHNDGDSKQESREAALSQREQVQREQSQEQSMGR